MSSRRVLLCAATSVEAKACRRGVSSAFEVLQTGMGPESAARALRTRLEKGEPPSLVISTGFAGALAPGLNVGSWVLATEIRGDATPAQKVEPLLNPVLARAQLNCEPTRWISISEVVAGTQHAKWGDLAEVVDLESLSLFEVCREKGIAFQALRMITDTPRSPIPRAIGTWAQAGEITPSRLIRGLGQAASEPAQFFSFVARASRFPARLTEGWRTIAAHWSSEGVRR